ncbi:MAG: lipid IV(A) 3-deoxy-D-manno-octulosonic acid transferase [Pseudomonadales bacterium]
MYRFLYSCVFYLALPLLLLRLWQRGRRAPAYRQRIGERFGFASAVHTQQPLWVHAVSVGETVAIAPVVQKLLARHPQLQVLLTTSTPTGGQRVADLFANQPRVIHQYCPYDFPGAVRRFLRKHRPLGLVVVETELWPNMLAQASEQLPVMLANARLSEKSASGYAKVAKLTRSMLAHLDLLVAQQEADLERFVTLGLARKKGVVNGSIKFDLQVDPSIAEQAALIKQHLGERPIIVLGSCHEGEERGVLEQLAQLRACFPDLLLIIVPRHPERFDEVAQLAQQYSSAVLRRSQADPDSACEVYIGDTMGELLLMYALADVAIVGGSFAQRGGQNPIEPASLAVPVLMGPHQYNFAEVCRQLESCEGLTTCESYAQLGQSLLQMLDNTAACRRSGEAAKAYYQSQRGASDRLLVKIEELCIKRR